MTKLSNRKNNTCTFSKKYIIFLFLRHRQASRLKEDNTIISKNEVSNRSSVYSFASAEGLADDPTGFTTNRSYYSYVETTPNQINSELINRHDVLKKKK